MGIADLEIIYSLQPEAGCTYLLRRQHVTRNFDRQLVLKFIYRRNPTELIYI